jgi:hypothetical protein
MHSGANWESFHKTLDISSAQPSTPRGTVCHVFFLLSSLSFFIILKEKNWSIISYLFSLDTFSSSDFLTLRRCKDQFIWYRLLTQNFRFGIFYCQTEAILVKNCHLVTFSAPKFQKASYFSLARERETKEICCFFRKIWITRSKSRFLNWYFSANAISEASSYWYPKFVSAPTP